MNTALNLSGVFLIFCGCNSVQIRGTEQVVVVEGRGCVPLTERIRIHTGAVKVCNRWDILPDYAEVMTEINY